MTTLTQHLPTPPHRIELTLVAGGSFRMGSDPDKDSDAFEDEQPEHEVQVSAFYMAIYPVTQALWREVVAWAKTINPDLALDPAPSFFTGEQRPVEQVSWDDARLFIDYLNQWTADTPLRQSGYTYRLPSEAEWEYAARGGAHPRGYKYAGSDLLKEVGWYADNSHGETKAVGLKAPNELGLYDMSGNVWEWCEDDWHGDYKKAPKDSRPGKKHQIGARAASVAAAAGSTPRRAAARPTASTGTRTTATAAWASASSFPCSEMGVIRLIL